MNLKDLLIPLLIALGITAMFNYFFGDRVPAKLDAERSRVAPKIEEINRPLNFEIDFLDADVHIPKQLTTVETQFSKFTFTNIGGCLEKAEFKHNTGNEIILMSTLDAQGTHDKAFMIALEEKTPLNYTLTEKHEDEALIRLSYTATNPVKITKQYLIYKNIAKIDLYIDIEASETNVQRMRLFYPSPMVPDLENDVYTGLINDGNKVVQKTMAVVKEGRYWETPTLFGTQDRYFIHAMTVDENHFIQRAYYKVDPELNLVSILEGSKLTNASTFNLSFFFGPKKLSMMHEVDTRLTGTLEYGWLEPLSVPLLKFLNYLNTYTHSYGWAIIIITLLMKLLMLPFTWRATNRLKASQGKQTDLQQKLRYIQEKYKDNPEALKREQAELIRKHALPGVGGCLPLLIQIPIFFALNRVLYNSVEMYKAPFLWIPDLSSYDPYYILPIIVGVGILFSGIGAAMGANTNTKSFDPKSKLVQFAMAIIIGAVSMHMSAGLTIYIALSTLLSSAQTSLQARFNKIS